MSKLNGKTAFIRLINSRRIGADIVKRLARERANITLTYILSKEKKAEDRILEIVSYGVQRKAWHTEPANSEVEIVRTCDRKVLDHQCYSSGFFVTGTTDEENAKLERFRNQ